MQLDPFIGEIAVINVINIIAKLIPPGIPPDNYKLFSSESLK
jgi:hypothetical protein